MTGDIIEGEVVGAALVPAPSQTVAIAVSVDRALAQWRDYQELTRQLLNETDYQSVGNKQFKKKSAWRKYANAFNISDRVSHEEIIRDPDGFPRYARIRVEAMHPNGRTAEADHECHLSERCCPAKDGLTCPKASWRGHTCCPRDCNGRIHWSHPGDVPATALTRAKNRAIADLIGAGEVSAEEMEGQDQEWVQGQRVNTRQQRAPQHEATQEASSPAPTRDQIGAFAKPDGTLNQVAFAGELTRRKLTVRDLVGIAPENAGGNGVDIKAWLRDNPRFTLLDLASRAECNRYGHDEPVANAAAEPECPRCHWIFEDEAEASEPVQQGMAV